MDKSLTPLLKSAELLANRLLGLLPDRAAVDWRAHRAAVWHGEGLDRGFALHPDAADIALGDLLPLDDP
ncbi:MAG: AAA family ATPase, partial [Gammaproteobacteria bacterium]|nr:AAA family ATPase [Gammaproteobacteria bacterium]